MPSVTPPPPANNPLPDAPLLPEIPLSRVAREDGHGEGNMRALPLEYRLGGASKSAPPAVRRPPSSSTGRTPAPRMLGPSHARPPVDVPRVRAAVCYVVPLLPALGLLLRER